MSSPFMMQSSECLFKKVYIKHNRYFEHGNLVFIALLSVYIPYITGISVFSHSKDLYN